MKLTNLNSTLLKNKDAFFVFAIVFIIFSAVQFSTESLMGGDDTYLYIKLAEMTKNGGLIKEFPWLNATIMKDNFTGLHFLYYILQIPFTFLGSLAVAAKVSSIFFLSLMFSVFYLILKSLKLRFGLFWTFLLLAGSGYFLFRMNFARPLNFSAIFTLIIFYSLIKKNNPLLFASSFLFVWAHGSFPLSIFLAFVFFIINYFHKRELYYKSVLFSFSGIILGSIINPFFPNNLNYFSIYYLSPTPYFLTSQIMEWQPIGLDDLFLSDATILIVLFTILSLIYVFSLVVSFINKEKKYMARERDKERKIILSFLFITSAIFFAATLLQGRFIDYLVPFSVMFIAFYFEFIYFDSAKNDKIKKVAEKIKLPKIFSKDDIKMTVVCFLFIMLGMSAYNKINFVAHMFSHSDSDIKETALWLKENTPNKSVVFNVNWGDFSNLFFYNSDNYYILGLDPKFLYLKSSEKYWLYSHIGEGIVCGKEECEYNEDGRTIGDVMKKEFNADYVYVPAAYDDFDYTNLINVMNSDSNFEKVFENSEGQIWKLK